MASDLRIGYSADVAAFRVGEIIETVLERAAAAPYPANIARRNQSALM
jgi:hypothetical protein